MSNRDMSETTMALLGKLIPPGTGRDAIHIAVAPAVAAVTMRPGQHCGFWPEEGPASECRVGPSGGDFAIEPVGIVDPYLPESVRPGDRFFVYLYPRTITSLRHEWTHPAFEDAPVDAQAQPVDDKAASERWIKAFADELDQIYNRLILAADEWLDGEEHVVAAKAENPGAWAYNDRYTYDNTERYKDVDGAKWPEFWRHFAIVTGRKAADTEACFFTCSC